LIIYKSVFCKSVVIFFPLLFVWLYFVLHMKAFAEVPDVVFRNFVKMGTPINTLYCQPLLC
jgi:hypothetical protein